MEEKVFIYMTLSGELFIGTEGNPSDEPNIYTRIYKPFRVGMNEDGKTSIASVLFGKEEYIDLKKDLIKLISPATESILDVYKKYKQKVYSEIVIVNSLP